MCCSHIKGRVFVALANGTLAVFRRGTSKCSNVYSLLYVHVCTFT